MVQRDKIHDRIRNRVAEWDVDGEIIELIGTTVTVSGRTRSGLRLNNDFAIQRGYDGTSYMANINIDGGVDSNSIVDAVSFIGKDAGIMKFNPNHQDPLQGIHYNNEGNWKIYQLATDDKTIVIGFADIIDRDDLSVCGWENEVKVLEFFSETDPIPYLTEFFFDTKLTIFYGEMSQANLTPNTITINTVQVFEPIDGMTSGANNQFTFQNGSELKCLVAGKYKADYGTCWDASNGKVIEFEIAVNGVGEIKTTACGRKSNANDIISSSGTGLIALAVDDLVTLEVRNLTDTSDVDIVTASINLTRIGS